MAGCVLGGGTAVNAALWWKANPADFDDNFPEGWLSADMEDAIDRVFDKIPWTDHPSSDNQLYYPQGYNIIGGALAAAGWTNITANEVRSIDQCRHVSSPPIGVILTIDRLQIRKTRRLRTLPTCTRTAKEMGL